MAYRARSLPASAAILLAGLILSGPAASLVEAESAYTKSQTYFGALRFLRVDLGYEITEKDPEAGYLLFQYHPPGRKAPAHGAIEVIEAQETVKLLVRLPQMPRYHEQVLSDGLLKKLRTDYGEPPKRPKGRKDHPPAEDADRPDGGPGG